MPVDQNGVCLKIEFGQSGGDQFQFGMKANFDFGFRWGMSGGMVIDEGSLDVTCKPDVNVSVAKDTTYAGPDLFLISTGQVPGQSSLDLETNWPNVEMYLDTYLDAHTNVSADFLYPGLTNTGLPTQENQHVVLMDATTNGEKMVDPDCALARMRVGVDGLSLFITGYEVFDLADGFDPPIEFAKALLTDPVTKVKVGLVLAEVGITFPDLSTPAAAGFNGVASSQEVLGFTGADLIRLVPAPAATNTSTSSTSSGGGKGKKK